MSPVGTGVVCWEFMVENRIGGGGCSPIKRVHVGRLRSLQLQSSGWLASLWRNLFPIGPRIDGATRSWSAHPLIRGRRLIFAGWRHDSAITKAPIDRIKEPPAAQARRADAAGYAWDHRHRRPAEKLAEVQGCWRNDSLARRHLPGRVIYFSLSLLSCRDKRLSLPRWSKDFLEAGKKRLAGDTARAATSDEVRSYGARPAH